jgi:MAM domain, meprin/A5/mu
VLCEVDMPFLCTFELDFCGMTSLPVGNFSWTRQSGQTDTIGTGPDAAFEGSYYAYAESSAPRQPGDKA